MSHILRNPIQCVTEDTPFNVLHTEETAFNVLHTQENQFSVLHRPTEETPFSVLHTGCVGVSVFVLILTELNG